MPPITDEQFDEIVSLDVRLALTEDIGSGDISAELIASERHCRARVISRQPAVICGRPWFNRVFEQLSEYIDIVWHCEEGQQVAANSLLCELSGPARAMISGERCALNFLQTLSGTASKARRYAERVADLPVRLLDTRKTLPGLRIAQKYAVKAGGCHNHRFGLYDAILVKENHLIAAGSIANAVASLRKRHSRMAIEIEVESLDEMTQAIEAGIKRLLLDNFSLDQLKAAVAARPAGVALEFSGNVDLDNVREIALTGVDYISIGDLTKNVEAVDLSMRFDMEAIN